MVSNETLSYYMNKKKWQQQLKTNGTVIGYLPRPRYNNNGKRFLRDLTAVQYNGTTVAATDDRFASSGVLLYAHRPVDYVVGHRVDNLRRLCHTSRTAMDLL